MSPGNAALQAAKALGDKISCHSILPWRNHQISHWTRTTRASELLLFDNTIHKEKDLCKKNMV